MNKLVNDLLDIDILLQSVETFIPIMYSIDNLNVDDPNYVELGKQINNVLKVLTAFSKDKGH